MTGAGIEAAAASMLKQDAEAGGTRRELCDDTVRREPDTVHAARIGGGGRRRKEAGLQFKPGGWFGENRGVQVI
jgi:hypothetical protein